MGTFLALLMIPFMLVGFIAHVVWSGITCGWAMAEEVLDDWATRR